MDLKNILLITQVVISIALITTILLQKRGASLGATFGGGGGGGYYQKRGAEKLLFNASIVLSILFIGVAFVILVIS